MNNSLFKMVSLCFRLALKYTHFPVAADRFLASGSRLASHQEFRDHGERENGKNRWDGGDKVTRLLLYIRACTCMHSVNTVYRKNCLV